MNQLYGNNLKQKYRLVGIHCIETQKILACKIKKTAIIHIQYSKIANKCEKDIL